MNEVTYIDEYVKCSICNKRKATLLCDMPKQQIMHFHVKLPIGETDFKNSFKKTTITCDNPICEKCATQVGAGIHFCKSCVTTLKELID